MIRKGRNIIRNHMTMEYGFSGLRIQDSFIVPVDWKLTIDLVALEGKNKSKDVTEKNAGIAYQKIYFWLDTNLQNVLAVDVSNETDLYIANLSSNITMYCPGNPDDALLIQLLHAKISTLADHDLLVGSITLKGSDTALQYTFECPEKDYSLPIKTEDYFEEGKTRDEIPWWFRNDGFCFEFVKPEDTDVSSEELFKDIVDPMDEFYKIINEMTNPDFGVIKEPAKIVQIEKWKPKTV